MDLWVIDYLKKKMDLWVIDYFKKWTYELLIILKNGPMGYWLFKQNGPMGYWLFYLYFLFDKDFVR